MGNGARVILAAALGALFGCGGGGGGGDTGGAPPGGGGITVTPAALTFTYVINGVTPPSQTVTASWTSSEAAYFAVAADTTPPSWLVVGPPSGSGTSRSVAISVVPSGTVGTRTFTLHFGIARADQSVIGYRDVTVTYVVKSFGATPSAVSSSAVLGSSVPPATKAAAVSAVSPTGWTASADRAWIHLSASSGTTPSSVTLSFDPAGLQTGYHTGTVTFTAGGETSAVAVNLAVVTPTLTVTPAVIELAGSGGHDLSPKPVQVALDTGTNAYGFTATATSDWIEVVQTATTVSSSAVAFAVRPTSAAAAWPAGSYLGAVSVSANVNGILVSRPLSISYVPDDAKLAVSDAGVAFTHTPSLSMLTRSLAVSTNRGFPTTWRATSDRAWLEVTSGGTTDDPLVLSVDPAVASSLAADALHEATVTVASSDPALAVSTETIRVGLWVGAASPEPVTTVAAAYGDVATDPVRPYAYFSDGSASIAIHNVLTGALATTITVPGASLRSLAVSADGARLFAVDASGRTVVPVDLETMTPGTAWPLPPAAWSATRIACARTNGVPLLVTTAGSVHDAATGASLATFSPVSSDAAVSVSRNGSRTCLLNHGLSPYTVQCLALDATTRPSAPSPVVLLGPARNAFGAGSSAGGYDVALSRDGARAYVASGGYLTGVVVYDATVAGPLRSTGSLAAAVSPTAVEVGWDGRVFAGVSRSSAGPTLWGYEPAGTQIGTWQPGNVTERLVGISGDGLRVVAGTGTTSTSDAVELVTVP